MAFSENFEKTLIKLFHFQYDPYGRLVLTFGKRPFLICIFEVTYVYNSVYCLSLPITFYLLYLCMVLHKLV